MRRIKYTKGQKIGELIFIEEPSPTRYPKRVALFMCTCGNLFRTMISNAKSGTTKSCGCLQKERAKAAQLKHGLSSDSVYRMWAEIKKRCYNKKYKRYADYGGRGIKMLESWRYDFNQFYNYIMGLPNAGRTGLTIDRENNDVGYFPNNLRWVDNHIQSTNKRKYKNNTSGYTGVSYETSAKRWRSRIQVRGEPVDLGNHKTPQIALSHRNNYIISNQLFEYKIQTP